MKGKTIILLLLVCLDTFGQKKERITIFKDSKVKIINFVIDKDPNRLPILNFTIQNNTKETIIFTTVALVLIEFKKHPLSSSGNNDLISKALTPIAGLDLPIPIIPNTYIYGWQSPIQIVKKDAATIIIRIHYQLGDKNIVPGQLGYFKFKLLFLTYDLKAVSSSDIELGNQ
ncbi:MAG: hypothetical protein JWQ34_1087 [Mucilaginibacter sp.]|uniref:hypothetical protein n=1 Tax=Mucilaginibacter sp. TaxID=1882438 RepID=UPI0026192373|nr:hypothetical protein [Mucilaginibacter sp.]MDB5002862.1 hypothetical protein [Mucilaginibacter sp.]